jgi:hypothetical protein
LFWSLIAHFAGRLLRVDDAADSVIFACLIESQPGSVID